MSKEVEDNADENPEAAEGAEGAEGGKKKSKLKLILMIVVPLLLLVGGGAGAYFTGMLDSLLGIEAPAEEGAEGENTDGDKQAKKDKGSDAKGDKKAKDGKGDKGGGADSAFLPIPTMLVNLNTDDGTPNYLRLTVQLELEDPADREAVEAVIPRVVDQFQTYLRELRVKDLRGSAGIYRLQMELLWRVNQAAAPVEIKDVLFQEILIN